MKKSLGVNAILNGIRTLLNLLFPLITFPYVSRVLQVENLGKYNFAVSVNQYFLMIAALGISTYAVREGSKFRENKQKFNAFASTVFTINLFSTALSYVLLFICIVLVPKFHEYSIILSVLSIEIIFTTIGTEWVYTIFEEYTYITVRSIIFKVVSIFLLLLLVKKPEDYVLYAAITVFATVGSNLLNYVRAKNYCSLKIWLSKDWIKMIRPILIIFASLAATSIYVNSDTIMLGFMGTEYDVGIYSVSSKVYRIVKQLLSAVLIVSIPRLALLMGQKRMAEYRLIGTKIFNVLVILVLPAVVGLFMLSNEVVLLISSQEYSQATSSLRLLSIALGFCIFGWFYNQCVLIPAKKEKVVLVSTLISVIVNISINLLFIPVWKENAVAFSTIVAEAIMMIICIFYGRQIVHLEKSVVYNTITSIFGCLGVVITCMSVKSVIESNIYILLLSVVLSIMIYAVILISSKNPMTMELIRKLRRR